MKTKIEKSDWYTQYKTPCCGEVVDRYYRSGKSTCTHCGTNIDYNWKLKETGVRDVTVLKKHWFLFVPYWKILSERLEYKDEKR